MKVNRQTSLFKTGRVQASLQEHQAVLDAIRVNDAAAAKAAMRAHFNNGLAAAQ
jgi:DNA-binding FadR family transcriptional regulator